MKTRINEAKTIVYKKTGGAGSHAEVYALNEALLNRPDANLDDFIVYVVSTKKLGKKYQRQEYQCQDVYIVVILQME